MYGLDVSTRPSLPAWARCVHPQDRRAFLDALSACIGSGRECDVEFRCCHRLRGVRWFRLRAEAGTDGKVLGLTQDITRTMVSREVLRGGGMRLAQLARKRGEELRKRGQHADTRKRMQESRLMSEAMANGLRNPLAALKLAVFNLKKRHYTPFSFDQFAHIDRKLEESSQAIQNMITYFSVGIPVCGRVDVATTVREAAAESRNAHAGVRGEVTLCLEDVAGVELEADGAQIRRMFRHVFDNAFEASDKRVCRITVTGSRRPAGVSVVVQDNGCGIPRNALPKVFMPLYTTKTKGSGLGLAISRQIVSLHDGTIRACSGKGKGTSISVFLPYTRCSLP